MGGQNFRLPELLGAVGLAACENLPVMIDKKRKINQWYKDSLAEAPIIFQKTRNPVRDRPVWWLNALKIRTEIDAEIDQVIEKCSVSTAGVSKDTATSSEMYKQMREEQSIQIRKIV